MQPLARGIHEVVCAESWEMVRDFSMSVVFPNSETVVRYVDRRMAEKNSKGMKQTWNGGLPAVQNDRNLLAMFSSEDVIE